MQRSDERAGKRQDSTPSCQLLLKALSCVSCYWSVIKGKSAVWKAAGEEEEEQEAVQGGKERERRSL